MLVSSNIFMMSLPQVHIHIHTQFLGGFMVKASLEAREKSVNCIKFPILIPTIQFYLILFSHFFFYRILFILWSLFQLHQHEKVFQFTEITWSLAEKNVWKRPKNRIKIWCHFLSKGIVKIYTKFHYCIILCTVISYVVVILFTFLCFLSGGCIMNGTNTKSSVFIKT